MKCGAWAATAPRWSRVGPRMPSSPGCLAPMPPSTYPITATSTSSWRSSSGREPTRCTRCTVTQRTSHATSAGAACARRRSKRRNNSRWRYERKPAGFLLSAPLAQGPAGTENRPAKVGVARGRVAEARQQEVQPSGEQHRWMELALLLVSGNSLDQVIEQLERVVVRVQRRVAEHAHPVERQRRRGADSAAHTASTLIRFQRAQSVYLVMI